MSWLWLVSYKTCLWVNKSSRNALYTYVHKLHPNTTYMAVLTVVWEHRMAIYMQNTIELFRNSSELGWACASIYRGSGQHLGHILTYSHNTCWCERTRLCYIQQHKPCQASISVMQVVCLHVDYGMDCKIILATVWLFLLTTCCGFYCPAFRQPPRIQVLRVKGQFIVHTTVGARGDLRI